MQIVINIPESVIDNDLGYVDIRLHKDKMNINKITVATGEEPFFVFLDFTPFPKGHGRLIDADDTLKRHCEELCRYKPKCEEDCVIYDLFHLAPTIIEEDKEK